MAAAFSFVQITDLHLTDDRSAGYLAEDLRQIEAGIGGQIDFIAATGDLTDHGTDEECRLYADAIKTTRLKVHPVVGNHDYLNGNWKDGTLDAASYIAHISTLNFSFDHKGVHFVSYDSIKHGNETKPSEWLLADLAAQPRERPIILLIHYQLAANFYDALKPFNIVATLSGHWHSSRLYHDGKIAHYNSPALCFGGIDYSARSYRVFRWDGKALRCETVALNRLQLKTRSASPGVETLWSAPLDAESHMSAVAASGDRVIAGLMNENEMNRGALACWDLASGKEIWRTPLSSSVKSTPAAHQDTAIAVTVTGEVVSVGAADGRPRWSYQLGHPSERWMFSAPLVHGGKVYAGQGPHFAALEAATGKPLWTRTDINGSDWISSYVSPVCDGSRIYMGFFWGHCGLLSLDAATGATVWRHEKGSHTSSTPALDGRGALYVLRGSNLEKINAVTGETVWKFDVGEVWNPSTPLAVSGVIYAASGAGKVFAVDTETGKQKWMWECNDDLAAMLPYRRTSKTIVSSPRLVDGCIAIGCNDGRLVGLDAKSGEMKWHCDFGVPVTSSVTAVGDRLILPIRDGRLYALRATSH